MLFKRSNPLAASAVPLRVRQTTSATEPGPRVRRGVVCVDLGTSSIRAAVESGGAFRMLRLGEIAGSEIDDASIPSAVCIDRVAGSISFGQAALDRIASKSSSDDLAWELSPKRWLSMGETAHQPWPRVDMNAGQIVASLLAYALAICQKAVGSLSDYEVRVAHPVWPDDVAPQRDAEFRKIVGTALNVLQVIQASAPLAKVRDAANLQCGSYPEMDVREPVAAALHLVRAAPAGRHALVVVDVGAGTIDLGFIAAVSNGSRGISRLIPLGKPRSIFSAGDDLDEALIQSVLERRPRNTAVDLADLRRRRRALKETLFGTGSVSSLGVTVTRSDVEQSPVGRRMASQLRENFDAILSDTQWMNVTGTDRAIGIDQINVMFAGGGAGLEFLHRALPATVDIGTPSRPRLLSVYVRSAPGDVGGLIPVARATVALGGCTPAVEWPRDKLEPVRRMAGLGSPLQDVCGPW